MGKGTVANFRAFKEEFVIMMSLHVHADLGRCLSGLTVCRKFVCEYTVAEVFYSLKGVEPILSFSFSVRQRILGWSSI